MHRPYARLSKTLGRGRSQLSHLPLPYPCLSKMPRRAGSKPGIDIVKPTAARLSNLGESGAGNATVIARGIKWKAWKLSVYHMDRRQARRRASYSMSLANRSFYTVVPMADTSMTGVWAPMYKWTARAIIAFAPIA
jgi:hypothetical protein